MNPRPPDSARGRARLWLGALEGAVVLVGVWLTLWTVSPARQPTVSRDSGAFLYIGWRWLEGEIPYRDVWDHKPPGVYGVDRLGLMLSPGTRWGVWALEGLFLAVAAGVGYWALRRLWGPWVALLSTYLWLYTLVFLLDGGNLTQEYALPFQFLMLAVIVWVAERPTAPQTAAAGLLGLVTGLAFLFRQNTIAGGLVGLTFWLADRRLPPRVRWRRLLAFGIGFAAVVGLTAAYFVARGAGRDFWDQAFAFNYLYAQERHLKRRFFEVSRGLLQFPATGLWPLAVVGYSAALAELLTEKAPSAARRFLVRLVALLPLEMLMVALPGRGRVPYFTSLLPVLAMLAGVALARVLPWPAEPRARGRIALAAAVLLLAWGWLHGLAYHDVVTAPAEASPVAEVVAYVRQHTRADDTVLVIGAEPEVNFLARRRSPTRFVYQYPLYRRVYAGAAMLEAFYRDVLRARPRLIIVTLPEAEGQIPDHFGPNRSEMATQMTQQIRRMYRPVTEIAGWTIYARVEP